MNWLDPKCTAMICKLFVHSHGIDSPAEPKRKLSGHFKHPLISFRTSDEFVTLRRMMPKVMLSSNVSKSRQ